jgi:hypothetical protein
MAFHLAHIHDYQRFLAVDLGSHRVRASLYNIENGQLILEWMGTTRQSRKDIRDWHIVDMRGVSLAIEKSITSAADKSESIPDDMILSFSSSEFIFDSVTTQYIRADRTSTITMEEIDTMIKKTESASFDRVKQKAKHHFSLYNDDVKLVSSTITAIEIDGKKITNPVWFPGWKVRLTVLNIFCPASEFNIIRSIVASIDKHTISLVPSPIVFPKILEHTEYVHETSVVIDLWYMHSTVMLLKDGQIEGFETFPIGVSMLIDILADKYGNRSRLSLENIICETEMTPIARDEFSEFFQYFSDTVFSFLSSLQWEKTNFSNLLLHWSIFENKVLLDLFGEVFNDTFSTSVTKHTIASVIQMDTDAVVPYGLALMASDLLVVKKDPLVRILRYVIYNYE